ncbi:ABC transporter permease [Paenibacillus spongiae]|uniref:ABC transporter permease n=1 Tax=Paenibacillus spongiae TaxID=2909671 RepID=A0ABY5S7T6_9BACL|nr:ABC transporter permease [Paenibacillus spongiae]UVI29971.1 ABC transporter permease [Paenibacillus spongiae]
MIRMFRSEWLKLRKSVIWLLAVVSPLLAGLVGFLSSLEDAEVIGGSPWLYALSMMAALHAMLFLPLLTGVFAALVCRYEHAGGGWKQLFSLPVSRSQVYLVKYVFIMLLLAITQLLFLAALIGIGLALGFPGPIPWKEIIISCAGGWIACLPLAALQLAVSTAWSSFAAPLAVNVVFTLPNMLVANSTEYGPYYPWVQPMLAMIPSDEMSFGAFNISPVTLFVVIGGSFLLFLVSGWTYFAKKAV